MTPEPGNPPIFAKILACVAPSPHLAALAREAVALAEICGSELVFLHVGTEGRQVEEGLGRALPQGLGSAAFLVRSGAPEATIVREAVVEGTARWLVLSSGVGTWTKRCRIPGIFRPASFVAMTSTRAGL